MSHSATRNLRNQLWDNLRPYLAEDFDRRNIETWIATDCGPREALRTLHRNYGSLGFAEVCATFQGYPDVLLPLATKPDYVRRAATDITAFYELGALRKISDAVYDPRHPACNQLTRAKTALEQGIKQGLDEMSGKGKALMVYHYDYDFLDVFNILAQLEPKNPGIFRRTVQPLHALSSLTKHSDDYLRVWPKTYSLLKQHGTSKHRQAFRAGLMLQTRKWRESEGLTQAALKEAGLPRPSPDPRRRRKTPATRNPGLL